MNPRIATLLALLGSTARVDSDDAGLDQAIEAAKGLQKARTDADEAAKKAEDAKGEELQKLKDQLEAMTAERDKLKTDIDEMKAEQKKKADEAERSSLLGLATALKVDGADKLDLSDLRQAIAKAHLPTLRADASDAYIAAVIDMAKTSLQRPEGREDGRRAWEGLRKPERRDGDDDGADPWTKQQDAAFRAGRGDK